MKASGDREPGWARAAQVGVFHNSEASLLPVSQSCSSSFQASLSAGLSPRPRCLFHHASQPSHQVGGVCPNPCHPQPKQTSPCPPLQSPGAALLCPHLTSSTLTQFHGIGPPPLEWPSRGQAQGASKLPAPQELHRCWANPLLSFTLKGGAAPPPTLSGLTPPALPSNQPSPSP